MLEVDVATYLVDDLIAKIDIATMAHALEARSPLLDHELMELAASIPAELQGARPREEVDPARGAARLAARRHPRPAQAGLLRAALELAARPTCALGRDVLLDPARSTAGTSSPPPCSGLLDRHDAGADGDAKRIWSLLMLELWHREFVDDAGARSPRGGGMSRRKPAAARALIQREAPHPHHLAGPQRGRAHRARRPRRRRPGAAARALDRRRRRLRRRHARDPAPARARGPVPEGRRGRSRADRRRSATGSPARPRRCTFNIGLGRPATGATTRTS